MKDTRFGEFGGVYAPEILMQALIRTDEAWRSICQSEAFRRELDALLVNYAGRETALTRAERFSKAHGFELWLKREDLLHTGAHKLNNALGQVLMAKHMGKTEVLAETGAGQHGVATATACAKLGMKCTVYMGAQDAQRQAVNVQKMELLGARVQRVHSGQCTLKDAVNEAMRAWAQSPETHYVLGSALGPHPFPRLVAGFHEVIGKEARAQILAQTQSLPDLVVACVGGGSNAIGIFRGFVQDVEVDLVGVEAGGRSDEPGEHAARFCSGKIGVLHGCKTYVLQDEYGQVMGTHSISAGLDYPSVGPEHAHLHQQGRARYVRAGDQAALEAFEALSQLEGIIPALESSHALGWVIQERAALAGKKVLLCLSGRGDKDLESYIRIRNEKQA